MKTAKQILEMAEIEAAIRGEQSPQTRSDVERLTGYAYNGPEPRTLGVTYSVKVVRSQ